MKLKPNRTVLYLMAYELRYIKMFRAEIRDGAVSVMAPPVTATTSHLSFFPVTM